MSNISNMSTMSTLSIISNMSHMSHMSDMPHMSDMSEMLQMLQMSDLSIICATYVTSQLSVHITPRLRFLLLQKCQEFSIIELGIRWTSVGEPWSRLSVVYRRFVGLLSFQKGDKLG